VLAEVKRRRLLRPVKDGNKGRGFHGEEKRSLLIPTNRGGNMQLTIQSLRSIFRPHVGRIEASGAQKERTGKQGNIVLAG